MGIAARYIRPADEEEAIASKSRLEDRGVFLAGGTDLMLNLPRPFEGTLIDLSAAGMDGIELLNGRLRIGAMVTAHQIATDPVCRAHAPLLCRAAQELGSPQIRSRATIGGNAINASPCADMVCALAALDAEAVFRGASGAHRVPVLEIAASPGSSTCAGDELLSAFEIPLPCGRGAFHKLGLRSAQAIAVASVAVVGTIDRNGKIMRLAIACGSLAPRVVRAVSVERGLLGAPAQPGLFAEASGLVAKDICPISDLRGSAAYRQAATVGILRRALEEVLSCA